VRRNEHNAKNRLIYGHAGRLRSGKNPRGEGSTERRGTIGGTNERSGSVDILSKEEERRTASGGGDWINSTSVLLRVKRGT